MIKVEFVAGPERGRLEVVELPFKIGRSSECEVCCDPEKYPTVSAEHVGVRATDDGQVQMEDYSKNGIFLNGKRVERLTTLSRISILELGQGGPRVKITVPEDAAFAIADPTEKPKPKSTGKLKSTAETKTFDPKLLEEPGAGPRVAKATSPLVAFLVGFLVVVIVGVIVAKLAF